MIGKLFYLIFYQPLYNALVFLAGIMPFHDIGLAIIILTLVVKIILFPLTHRLILTQRKMKEVEPEVNKIKERFKKDNKEQTKQIMVLYKNHGISPFSGFWMLLIQLPIFITLYKLFAKGINFNSSDLYFFVNLPEVVQIKFLGLIDLTKGSYALAVLAGVAQFFQTRFSIPSIKKSGSSASGSFQDNLNRSLAMQAKYFMPVIIALIAMNFAGLALYLTAMSAFAIVHEAFVSYKAKKIKNESKTGIREKFN